ncbi:MAG: ABC transporter permease [Lachnospiraceae bacterium]|nr:ABC transporter permease [Lachnospiraceae bacterium]
MQRIKDIYEYRDMVFSLVKRELRGRYQKSVLGMLWTFLNPLCQIIVYTFVFSVIFENNMENYYIYLTVGMIPWTFFNEAVGQGAGSIVNNADMTKKIYFPREVLTIASVTSKFVNMLLSFVIVFLFIFISGIGVNPAALLWLIPVMIAEYLVALGFTLFFSAITVYLRDMEYIVGVLMMAWIWATPIMYTLDGRSEAVITLLKINPMTNIILAYHDILYYKVIPSIGALGIGLLVGFILLVIGEIVFIRLEGNFAEEL